MDRSINLLHTLAGFITWAVVFGLSIVVMLESPERFGSVMPEAIALQLAILALMLIAASPRVARGRPARGRMLFTLMLALVMLLGWRTPIGFLLIYTIIWIAMAPYYFERRTCFLLLLMVAAAWYCILTFSWGDQDALMEVLLFGTFHLFALLSSLATRSSSEASERAQALNRELRATQYLLAEASRQGERTRIARNLHDLLGHHLTALTIYLQVASRQTVGEAHEKVEQCHALSRLLLSDVRDAVGALRDEPMVNVADTLQLIVENVPNLNIHLDIDPALSIDDVNVAEALLRCVQEATTNTLRHAGAESSWIRVWQEHGSLCLSIHDDGAAPRRLVPGNGLRGMRERIERLNGQLVLESLDHLHISARIPLAAAA